MLLKILQCTGQPATTKAYLSQNVNRAEPKKLCMKQSAQGQRMSITPWTGLELSNILQQWKCSKTCTARYSSQQPHAATERLELRN